MNSEFVHLHNHSDYSLLDGAQTVQTLVNTIDDLGMDSVALTEHGNMFSVIPYYKSAKKAGVKPIIGCETYVAVGSRFDKKPRPEGGWGNNHLVLLAQNYTGYQNLMKLVTHGYLDGFYYRPRIDLDLLKENSEGLICLSGCLKGEVTEKMLKDDWAGAKKAALRFAEIFDGRFYLEVQNHGIPDEIQNIQNMKKLASELDLPLVCTNDAHYAKHEHWEAHDVHICLGTGKERDDPNRLRYATPEFYFKTQDQMFEMFKDVPNAIENTRKIADSIDIELPMGDYHLPNFPLPDDAPSEKPDEYLKILCKQGVQERYGDLNPELETRLDHELRVIEQMGFAGYFLITADFVKYAKDNSIPVGPGRGSAAGSLVSYSLGITTIDPIKHKLLFERFLNPDRISMPDIDIDFCIERRGEVIDYIKSQYGENSVTQIITFGKLQARMAIRDIGRVIGLPYSVVDSLSKMIPFDPSRPLSLQESVALEPRIQEAQKNDVKIDKLIKLAIKLEGLYRNIATHAAGIVIADRQIEEIVPLYKDFGSDHDIPVTQFDMKWSENAGLVKFDFLGLKTLTVIKKTVNSLKENNININLKDLPLDDPKTFELLCSGETMGVFQLESAGMREVLKQMKPNKFEDIIALVALFRPGPMQNISKYNNCKHGIEKPDYLHPKIEHILKETYGVIIYQEQVMQIAQSLSGFSAGKADILRKAMGKKKSAEMERQKKDFIEGAVKNGITKDQAVYIFQLVEKFAQYGFNKSHAAAYALIAYQTAYLKTHYPFYFVAASMNLDLANTDKLNEFYEELKRLKIDVVLPSINESFADFVVRDNKVYYALAAIKAVGYESVNQIISDRKNNGIFKSLEDFILRIDSKLINKLQMEGLIKSGAFDCLENNRKFLFDAVPEIIKISKNYKEANLLQDSLFGNDKNSKLPSLENFVNKKDFWNQNEKMKNEFESIGFFISEHPLLNYEKVLKTYNVKRFSDISDNDLNREFVLSGTLMAVQEKKTAKGQPFAIIKLSDLSRMYELFIFSEILLANRDKMVPGNSFLINIVKEKMTNGTTRLTTRKLTEINSIKEAKINNAEIIVKNLESINELKKILKDGGDTKVLIRMKSKDKNYAFNLKTSKLIDASIVSVLNSSGFECKIH